jgi:hypothetical protein
LSRDSSAKPEAQGIRHQNGYLFRTAIPAPGGSMNEKEMQALLKKTMAKAAAKKNPNRPTYDKALDAIRGERPEASEDATEIFKEMKKRTF